VAFTTANRGAGNHDRCNKTSRCADGGGIQPAAEQDHQSRRQTEHTEPTTSTRVKSGQKHQRRDDDARPSVVSDYMDARSLSVPVIVDSIADHCVASHRRRTAADRTAGITTAAVSTRVDSGVSGMQSSVCTLASSATQHEPRPDLCVEAGEWSRAQCTNCLDTAVGNAPDWNLSRMSMDVRSCPGGTAGPSSVSLLPPLFLYQYVNGYSDAMLMHVADRSPPRHSLPSSAASTTATHCAADADGAEACRRCVDAVGTLPVPRGGLTVQTEAIVEPHRTASNHNGLDSPCVCGQSHDLPASLDQDLPPPPSDICAPPSPSTATVRDLSVQLHFPTPPSSVCGQPFDVSLPPPDCDRQRPIELLNTAVKATTPSEVERRCLLARLLLGHRDDLTLSPVYIDETYF